MNMNTQSQNNNSLKSKEHGRMAAPVDSANEVRNKAGKYITITSDYVDRHPWRIAIKTSAIGFVAGALLFCQNSESQQQLMRAKF